MDPLHPSNDDAALEAVAELLASMFMGDGRKELTSGKAEPKADLPAAEGETVDHKKMLAYVKDIARKIDVRRFPRYDDFVNRIIHLALTAKNPRIREAAAVYLGHLLKKAASVYNSSQDMLDLLTLEIKTRKEYEPEFESMQQFAEVCQNRAKFAAAMQDDVQTPQTEKLLKIYYPEEKTAEDVKPNVG